MDDQILALDTQEILEIDDQGISVLDNQEISALDDQGIPELKTNNYKPLVNLIRRNWENIEFCSFQNLVESIDEYHKTRRVTG